MPCCSFPWHKHLPRLAQKTCYTVYSLNLIHEFTSVFSTNLLYVGLPRKAFPGIGKGRHWTSVFFCGCASNAPRFAQGYFRMKELDRTTEAIVPMNESWRRLNANMSQTQYVPLCANIASHQLYRERQPLWKSRDGLNLTCLDQCHGVRFQGTSTSQGWRKRIVIQSTV